MLCRKLYLVESVIITVSKYILQCRDTHLYQYQLCSGYKNTDNGCMDSYSGIWDFGGCLKLDERCG